nr:immunoglobulin light chain junction region [Macaca mulatta]
DYYCQVYDSTTGLF